LLRQEIIKLDRLAFKIFGNEIINKIPIEFWKQFTNDECNSIIATLIISQKD